MANSYRYRYGDTNPVSVTFDSTLAIGLGDLCLIASTTTDITGDVGVAGKLYSVAQTKWDTALSNTQTNLHPLFAGVAMQQYDGTNTSAYGLKDGKLRIATDGVFEFTTASASYKVGDLVGPAKASGNALEAQKVAAVATEALAIGRVVESTSSATTVKVRIFPPKSLVLS